MGLASGLFLTRLSACSKAHGKGMSFGVHNLHLWRSEAFSPGQEEREGRLEVEK